MDPFRRLDEASVRWRPVSGAGLEHLTVCAEGGSIHASSVVIGESRGAPFGLRYDLVCDAAWTVRSLDLRTTARQHVHLEADGQGRWRDAEGQRLPGFDGCLDVDLSGTPVTNTLPVRRLGLSPDVGAVELDMVYVPFDTFVPARTRQRYRCLEAGYLFRFETEDGSFAADLPLDEDGLVIDYPALFERIEPATVYS